LGSVLFSLQKKEEAFVAFEKAATLAPNDTQAMLDNTMSAATANSLAARIEVNIGYCPKCHRGILTRTLQTGQGDSLKTKILDPIDFLPDFVKQIL
jgi:hypothetical protein